MRRRKSAACSILERDIFSLNIRRLMQRFVRSDWTESVVVPLGFGNLFPISNEKHHRCTT